MSNIVDDETFETVTYQIGLLHGGLVPCSNEKFPAIYIRIDSPIILQWLKSEIKMPNFWPTTTNTGMLNFTKFFNYVCF